MKNNIARGFICCAMVAVVSTAFTSCRFEDEDLFDESPALRIEHTGDKLKQILTEAPNGWVMQYFCGKDISQFEGFNLFAKFDKNGKVTFAGNHRYLRDGNANKYTEAVSTYNLQKEDGLVLEFSTWNDVLTPFSDPVSPWLAPTYVVKNGEGMHGDHNFCVLTINDNEVIMIGQRHQATVRLVKCDRSWTQYIDDTEAMKQKIWSDDIHSLYVMDDEQTLYMDNAKTVNKHDGVFRFCDDLNYRNAVKADSVAFVFTPTGLRFEKVQTVGRSKFQEMRLLDDNTALINEDGNVKMAATWDRFIAERTTIWYMDDESLSDDLKQLKDVLAAAITASNKNYTLAGIGIGKTTNANNVTGLVVQWYTNTRKTIKKMGGVALNRMVPKYGQLTISCDEEPNIDNELNGRGAAVIKAARDLAKGLAGTYNLNPESYMLPSPVEAVSVTGTTKFKLANK